MTASIALINASKFDQLMRKDFEREFDADLTEFDANNSDLPDTYEFDGIVITGSAASVYWDDDWIQDLLSWAQTGVNRDVPFLGVCFGHQVMAEVLGGTVEGMGEYELGYTKVQQVGESELFQNVDDPFVVFNAHSDTVTELPDKAQLLAENEFGVHAFQKDKIFTIQGHPEYDLETAREVTKAMDVPESKQREVLADITPERYAEAANTKRVLDSFLAFVDDTE
jgi:GMP synthase (glutamine-hydrolysing)